MFEYEDWEDQEECDHAAVARSAAIEAVIKNHTCHHFDQSGDFIVGRWVMVAEIIDQFGDRRLALMASPQLESWEAYGMIHGIGMA